MLHETGNCAADPCQFDSGSFALLSDQKCSSFSAAEHDASAKDQAACAQICEDDATCDHFAVGSDHGCYTYVECVLASGSVPGLAYYAKRFEDPADQAANRQAQGSETFNGIVLRLNGDGDVFLPESECEDYGYTDVGTNRYDASRTMCEPTITSETTDGNRRDSRCYFGKGTVLCSAGGSFESYAELRSSAYGVRAEAPVPTANCIACPKGYLPTRYFGGGETADGDTIPGFNIGAPSDHWCPIKTKNKLECQPAHWGDFFKTWGDKPLASRGNTVSAMGSAKQNVLQCAPWGTEGVGSVKRHCLAAGTRFTRYNYEDPEHENAFWLVYCSFAKHVYCETTEVPSESDPLVKKKLVRCVNKKFIKFAKAQRKADFQNDFPDDSIHNVVRPANLAAVTEDGSTHTLNQVVARTAGLCDPVGVLS